MIAILAASNVVSNRVWPDGYLVWNVTVTVGLLVLARYCGLGRAELGLGRAPLRRGLLAGAAVFAAVSALFLLALAIPATHALFVDSRAAGTLGATLFAALVRIPLGTVLLEETAFRGVLPALVGGGGWGTVAQCALAVAATFVAGIVLSALRRWGGHLVTPMLAHVATNSVGVLLAWWALAG